MRRTIRLHWPFVILAALGLALLLTGLGSDYLWEDEGDTAILASNIVKYGVPKAWDGVTFTDSDRGARVNDDLVMVSHPWVQYYVAAASFLVFGQNTFSARLPFALAGWLTILLVYAFVWQISRNRWAAFCAAALMVFSVQFLLYSRQCRNYSLNMLFTCFLFWMFFRMKSARESALFAVAAILLFHTHPIGLVAVGILGILTLIYKPLVAHRRWFWLATPAIAILTLPWLALAHRGYSENTQQIHSIGEVFERFGQYLIECASVTPLIGSIVLLGICLMRSMNQGKGKGSRKSAVSDSISGILEKNESALFVTFFATLFSYALAMAFTESTRDLWFMGIRYTPAMIPLVAMMAGILIVKVARARVAIWLPLLLLFGFTKLALVTPWFSLEGKDAITAQPEQIKSIEAHVPSEFVDRFLGAGQLGFLRDLGQKNPGTLGQACEFLKKNAKPGDVLVANYGWEPLYFYTRLPQALKILSGYPVYDAARRKGLPEYVFGVDHVRWLVWRFAWDGYLGYYPATVEQQILAQGGRLTPVATLKESRWENRENIHFRRLSGERYLFPWSKRYNPAYIFRVDWPDESKPGP
jgi:4-amino-4-deoxy-L-arabinose transferase-like glycosyltransferase